MPTVHISESCVEKLCKTRDTKRFCAFRHYAISGSALLTEQLEVFVNVSSNCFELPCVPGATSPKIN